MAANHRPVDGRADRGGRVGGRALLATQAQLPGPLADRPAAARAVFLTADRAVLHARLAARHGHFFSANLLDSQFADLEPPKPPENVLVLDATKTSARLVDEITARLSLAPAARREG